MSVNLKTSEQQISGHKSRMSIWNAKQEGILWKLDISVHEQLIFKWQDILYTNVCIDWTCKWYKIWGIDGASCDADLVLPWGCLLFDAAVKKWSFFFLQKYILLFEWKKVHYVEKVYFVDRMSDDTAGRSTI